MSATELTNKYDAALNGKNVLVAGWHNGITGPTSLANNAAADFNRAVTDYCGSMRIHTYPVVFKNTQIAAFDLSICISDNEMTKKEVEKLLAARAEKLVEIFNAGVEALLSKQQTKVMP